MVNWLAVFSLNEIFNFVSIDIIDYTNNRFKGYSAVKILQGSGVNTTEGMNNADLLFLVSQCISGNEEAIEHLFRQHEPGVFRLALSIVDDPAEASEITQQTFISAIKALGKYQEKQSFKAWLYTICLLYTSDAADE